jgi:hypothetical protein
VTAIFNTAEISAVRLTWKSKKPSVSRTGDINCYPNEAHPKRTDYPSAGTPELGRGR